MRQIRQISQKLVYKLWSPGNIRLTHHVLPCCLCLLAECISRCLYQLPTAVDFYPDFPGKMTGRLTSSYLKVNHFKHFESSAEVHFVMSLRILNYTEQMYQICDRFRDCSDLVDM